MIMRPWLRKFALTAHVTASVGWLGAVAAFLALAVVGLTSRDTQRVRAAYVAMEVSGWFVIVPLSFASLLTGLIQALGTTWGLFRHYWVLAKLLINILSTFILLVHMQPISRMAGVAAETTLSSADFRKLRIQLVADAGAALVALLVATTLSVYKPRGMTRYGWRKQQEERMVSQP
jgi:predicted Co/Zn/Cd cation transporter (cation efflux family)